MKIIALSTFFLFIVLSCNAQTEDQMNNRITNFNSFQETRGRNADSAMYFLRRLVAVSPDDAVEVLHNSFAQTYLPKDMAELDHDPDMLASLKKVNVSLDSFHRTIILQQIVSDQLLLLMKKDTSGFIKNNIFPIIKWKEAQDNSTDPAKLLIIGQEFLKYLEASNNMYSERKGRYGLLIANLMTKHEQLKPASEKLRTQIYKQLESHQVPAEDNESRNSIKTEHAWYRYMFAAANYFSAQEAKTRILKNEYLRKAASFSSGGMHDSYAYNAYFYDMIFLFGKEKASFEEDYVAVLANDEDKLKMLMQMSFTDPSYKIKARNYYKGEAKFNSFWLSEFDKNFPTAPTFSMTQIDGTPYTLGNSNGRWTLIDFWGTWCPPCRQEHPDMEKLYQFTKDGHMPQLNLITIACRDREDDVKRYMTGLKYTFPVIMSDQDIEARYKVSSWPSKFLVSPQGHFVEIPFNSDWKKYIQDYIREL